MNQPTTHAEQLTYTLDGKTYILTPTKLRGMACCKACALDSVCQNVSLKLYLPNICSSMIEKGVNFLFVESAPKKN